MKGGKPAPCGGNFKIYHIGGMPWNGTLRGGFRAAGPWQDERRECPRSVLRNAVPNTNFAGEINFYFMCLALFVCPRLFTEMWNNWPQAPRDGRADSNISSRINARTRAENEFHSKWRLRSHVVAGSWDGSRSGKSRTSGASLRT